MSETSSIDDLLAATISKAPLPPAEVAENQSSVATVAEVAVAEEPEKPQTDEYGLQESQESQQAEQETDDYGNPTPPKRQYTQEEADEYANRIVRERLSRMERNNNPPTQQQIQQAQQSGFQYNPESAEDWQQQLAQFTEQIIIQREQRQAQQAQQAMQQRLEEEFRTKFQSGMHRFNDFTEVVQRQPITEAMAQSLAGVKDPSAFIYAASKRMPDELKRISQIDNPITQMVEMGKLEERMKQNKPATKTPKPLGRTQEDLAVSHKSDKQPTIEELIAADQAKRIAQRESRRRR